MVHVHSTVVVVDDQDQALDFYTQVLGWEVRHDNQMSPDYRFLVVAPPDTRVALPSAPNTSTAGRHPAPTPRQTPV